MKETRNQAIWVEAYPNYRAKLDRSFPKASKEDKFDPGTPRTRGAPPATLSTETPSFDAGPFPCYV